MLDVGYLCTCWHGAIRVYDCLYLCTGHSDRPCKIGQTEMPFPVPRGTKEPCTRYGSRCDWKIRVRWWCTLSSDTITVATGFSLSSQQTRWCELRYWANSQKVVVPLAAWLLWFNELCGSAQQCQCQCQLWIYTAHNHKASYAMYTLVN